jgi:hypothetical protein
MCAIRVMKHRQPGDGTLTRNGPLAWRLGRNQAKARTALVSLGVGIGLDQPTVVGTAQRKKRKSRACMARAPDLRRCRCNLRLRHLRYLRFPFLAPCDTPRAITLAGKGSGETARCGQCIGK